MVIELDFLGVSKDKALRIVNDEIVEVPTGSSFDTWVVLDDGLEVATIEVEPQGDTLQINSISSEGGPSTLGPGKVRSVFRMLTKEYPGVTKVSGKRVTGARTSRRKSFKGDFGVPQMSLREAPEVQVRIR